MIETDRTFIRPIEAKDKEQVFAYRSDAETNKYQGWIPKSLEDVNGFISKNPKEFNTPETWFQLVIIRKDTSEIIGDIGVHFIDAENCQCEIGCTIRKEDHGKGIATEVMKATINYLFKELKKHRIIASIDPLNFSSIKLVERLGYRKEAHFRKSLFINGEWVDDIIYAMLNSDRN